MAEEKPNPITAHLLNLVQGRQQTEVAKLTLLTQLHEKLVQVEKLLARMEPALNEIVERSRER